MLPQENRIKKKNDFEAVFKKSKTFRNSFFVLKISKNSSDLKRIGFVVSQKVSKKAVERNRVRRRMSSIVSKELEKIKPGFDLVFIVLSGIIGKDFYQIKDKIELSLSEAGVKA